MTIFDFLEQINFATKAIENKNNGIVRDSKVVILLNMKNNVVTMNIDQIGFDEKSRTIYLEVR